MIPRVIYQTWRTKDERAWRAVERRWVRTWRANSGWRHELHDDDDCLRLVRRHYPDALEAYQSLWPVEKADLWRYMILHSAGGMYVDFDTSCRVPIDRWLRGDDELVLGLMNDYVDRYPQWRARQTTQSGGAFDPTSPWCDNRVMFTNWAMASTPGHPLIADVIRRVTVNARDPFFEADGPGRWVCKKTGPGVLTDALERVLLDNGTTLNEVAARLRRNSDVRIGSVRMLDYAAFHTRYVVHLGIRSWSPRRRGVDWLVNRIRRAIT